MRKPDELVDHAPVTQGFISLCEDQALDTQTFEMSECLFEIFVLCGGTEHHEMIKVILIAEDLFQIRDMLIMQEVHTNRVHEDNIAIP